MQYNNLSAQNIEMNWEYKRKIAVSKRAYHQHIERKM